jgi:hypothetical protein
MEVSIYCDLPCRHTVLYALRLFPDADAVRRRQVDKANPLGLCES